MFKLVNIYSWMASWIPNPATTTWSKGIANGCFYRSPLAAWEAEGFPLPPKLIASLDDRLRKDFESRGLFARDPEGVLLALDTSFDPIKPYSDGKNAWDPLHFGIAPILEDLDRRGSAWAFSMLMTLIGSYYNSKKFPYLRTGGNEPWYGTQGRPRLSGWLLLLCASVLRTFQRYGIVGPYPEFLRSLVSEHLARIDKALPLQAEADGPNGDHLNVVHVEPWMLGILGEALKQLHALGFEVASLRVRVRNLVRAARVGIARYVYDLRIDPDGFPLPVLETDKIVTGFGGTNSWIVGAFEPTDGEFTELLEAALKAQIEEKNPAGFANFFGPPPEVPLAY